MIDKNLFCNKVDNDASELFNEGKYELALKKYEQLLAEAQKTDSNIILNKLQSKIAVCYNRLERPQEAEEFFKKSLHSDWQKQFKKNYYSIAELPPVYSFRPISKYALYDLESSSITLSNPKTFNDPFDCPIFSYLKKSREESNRDNLYMEKAYERFKIRCFVCNRSFEDGNLKVSDPEETIVDEYKNFLMWSHYADYHRGMCIKYKFDKSFSVNKLSNDLCFLGNVEYYRDFPKSKYGSLDIVESLLYKNDIWRYENEVRLLNYDPSCESDYKSIAFDRKVDIEAVYFGYRCKEDDKKLVESLLKEKKILFYDVYQNPTNMFELDAKIRT